MLNRLAAGKKTPAELVQVAIANEWCLPTDTWPLSEEKLESFLEPDNWDILQQALEAGFK